MHVASGGVFFSSDRFSPTAWALAWVLGCLAQLQQPRLWDLSHYVAVLITAAATLTLVAVYPVWSARKATAPTASATASLPSPSQGLASSFTAQLVGLLACMAVAFAGTGLRAVQRMAGAFPSALEGQDLWVSGLVVGLPQATEAGLRFELRVEAVHPRDGQAATDRPATRADPATPDPVQPHPLNGETIQLTWYGLRGLADDRTSPVPRVDDRWLMLVRLKQPHGLANPGGSDAELYAWSRGVRAVGYVRDGPRQVTPVLLAPGSWWGLGRVRQLVRDAILKKVEDRSAAGVLAALVVGDQSAILPADWALYRATGIAHLVSISGLHVTAFAWLAAAFVGAAWRRSAWCCEAWPAPHAAVVGGIVLAACYAAFSGGGVPAQRTVGMLALAALLRLGGCRWPWPATWAAIAAAVAAWDPWSLLQAGFWLSFMAVAALIATTDPRPVAGPPVTAPARSDGLVDRLRAGGHALRTAAAALWREQLRITLALAPLTLYLFGQVSIVGVLANLIAIPWVTAWVLPLALLGTAWPALWGWAAASVQALGALLEMLAVWPGGVLVLPAAPAPLVAAALLGAALLALRLPAQLRLAGLPLVLPWLLWQPPAPAPGSFDLLGVDVGQGQAVLVRTAHHALLYDAGPRWGEESDAGAQVLVPLLRSRGVTLDLLVISHADSDHAGGAAAVLSDQRRAGLLASLPPGHALAAHRPPQVCLAGQRWSWDGVQLEVLHPQEADLDVRRPNALSCVLRLVAANGAAALLAGDLEAPQERRVVRQLPRAVDAGAGTPGLQADLLLVPHHGSRTSSSEAWLDAVRPRLALVQAGYRNRYGHPAADVMARYAQRGIPVALTPGCGAAFWSSEAPGVLRCQRALAPRYWQHQPPAWAGAAPMGETEADQTEAP